jgi:beta-galactosidase
MLPQQTGQTIICKWKDDKAAAFSVGGDDSLRSQLDFAIPEMDKRGLRGTWWVNPGRGGAHNFKKQDDAWANCWIARYDDWKAAAARGHDFANHTLHHLGATDYQNAEDEIREAARIIRETNPRQKLLLFQRGGGTDWAITEEQLAQILAQYDCVQGRGGGIEDPTWETNPSADTLRGFVDAAIREGSWHHLAFHGIGPKCEWGGPVDGDAFIALLDYLVEQGDRVWTGTHTEVHMYDQERGAAAVTVLGVSERQIRLALRSTTNPKLYDYPLTLRTRVPDDWESVRVTQGERSADYPVVSGSVQFGAVPGSTDIWLASMHSG